MTNPISKPWPNGYTGSARMPPTGGAGWWSPATRRAGISARIDPCGPSLDQARECRISRDGEITDITGLILDRLPDTLATQLRSDQIVHYLVGRAGEFSRLADILIPFLVTRQIVVGAGKITQTPRGASYSVSQRAEHIWEGVSSATTRSRPIINTRDEPHADAEKYRRLHVIVGDSNMSETTTLLKVASCDLVLRMIEEGVVMRDLTMENPIRAIREISHDVTGRRKVRLANGREASALEIQGEYLGKARDFVDRRGISTPTIEMALDLWERGLKAVESDDLGLVDREIDWVIKWKLIERYRAKHGLPLGHPRIAQLDLAYHDIHRGRGLYYLLEKRGAVARVTSDLKIFEAKSVPPQNTRARLRGEFIRRAQERRRDFTVDWVHLKLNDQAQRTVLCKDPFRAYDERVQRLIDGM